MNLEKKSFWLWCLIVGFLIGLINAILNYYSSNGVVILSSSSIIIPIIIFTSLGVFLNLIPTKKNELNNEEIHKPQKSLGVRLGLYSLSIPLIIDIFILIVGVGDEFAYLWIPIITIAAIPIFFIGFFIGSMITILKGPNTHVSGIIGLISITILILLALMIIF